MDRIGAHFLRHRNHTCDVEIGVHARPLQDPRLIARPGVQRGLVIGRVDHDGCDTELAGSPRNANGNLAAIGDQKLLDGHAIRAETNSERLDDSSFSPRATSRTLQESG